MTTADPFLPRPEGGEGALAGSDEVAAADPGAGAPPPAEGFGRGAEEPDTDDDVPDPATEGGLAERVGDVDTPFRTPDTSAGPS